MADGSGPSNTASRPEDVNGELQYYKTLLERFLHLIRHDNGENISHLISVIQSDISKERILTMISEAMRGSEQSEQGGGTEGWL